MIQSDIHTLQKVLIHSPGSEIHRQLSLASIDSPYCSSDLIRREAIDHHKQFKSILESHCECIEVTDEIDAILSEWDVKKKQQWEELIGFSLNVDTFIGRKNTSPLKWLYYTRDQMVMTPHGVILCNFMNYDRARESAISQFLLAGSSHFQDAPVILNACKENHYIQGGDVIVKDLDTLLIGCGNLTSHAAAKEISKRTKMDVVAVQMPKSDTLRRGYSQWNGLHEYFLHLDSMLNLVDQKKVLSMPYILEQEYRHSNPFLELLSKIHEETALMQADDSHRHNIYDGELLCMQSQIPDIGNVTIYSPTGREEKTDMKIVDYLVQDGYEIIRVGGEPSIGECEHMLTTTLPELRFQGANVVAIGPGHIVAYAENISTLAALRANDVIVETFPGYELSRWNGGPHCMTMPIARY